MFKWFFLLCVLCNDFLPLFAQQRSMEELIATSQSGGSDIFFKANLSAIPQLNAALSVQPSETNVRQGLPYFFAKAKAGKEVRIAYIGGSITKAGNQYREQSFNWIQRMFPHTPMLGINAGVSGTDADLGACRLYEQVLKYKPDLVFVEFAVNGGYPQGMEGIVRQIVKRNPETDICFIYTVNVKQFHYYQEGNVPPGIRKLEEIADHYYIPSIHLGMEAAELEKQGKLRAMAVDRSIPDSLPVFFTDGVHPTQRGGDLYASAIARSFIRMQKVTGKKPRIFKEPLYKDNWENALMVDPGEVTFSEGWDKTDPSSTFLQKFKSWFPYLMVSEKEGASFTFKYIGNGFGIFDIGAPGSDQIEIFLDGRQVGVREIKGSQLYAIDSTNVQPVARFNKYSNNRTRGQYMLIQTPDGKDHVVTIKVSGSELDKAKILGPGQLNDITKNPGKYNHKLIYIGKILINGQLK